MHTYLKEMKQTREHGSSSRQDGVGVQVLPNVDVALHDGVVRGFVNSRGLHSQHGRLEHGFRAPEPFVSDRDHL